MTMKYRYRTDNEMKDSGVEWLGKIPKEWEVSKLKNCFDFYRGLPITKSDLSDEGIQCLNYGEVHSKYPFIVNTENNKLKKVSIEFLKTHPDSLLNYGDIVFADTSEDLKGSGNFTFVDGNAKIFAGYHTITIRSKEKDNLKYFAYLFEADKIRKQIQLRVKGVKVYSITQSILKEVYILKPQEQQKIALFLDKKTAEFDSIIEKKQSFITKLTEAKKSLISEVVTGKVKVQVIGNKYQVISRADDEMKDSGVEWLGKIPKEWEVKRLKYIFEIKKRISGEEGYDVLSITQKGIKIKDIKTGEGQLSMDYSKYQFVYPGDFAMNHMDLLTGFVDLSKFFGVTSPDYRVFSLKDNRNIAEYFLLLLQVGYNNKIFFGFGQGSSQFGRWRFPTQAFNDFYFPFPIIKEQNDISNFINEKTAKIDSTIEKINLQIEKLKGAKQSLISEAVTGKIEVI